VVDHQPRAGRRSLVWIVDDSATEALIAERSLGPAYDFERFDDGSAVVERLFAVTAQPDLVLLDWVMPGMAGDEVCRFLRADPRTLELPIILITNSRIETSDITQGLTSGANDYIARPFAAEELRARVESAIRARRLGDLVQQESRRLATINRLGRALLEARADIPRLLDALAKSLTAALCDGCSIVLPPNATVTSQRVGSSGETAAPGPLALLPLSRREQIRGVVRVTRDGGAEPFDSDDLAAIETCIEYASLAIESAMRADAERLVERAVHAERERIAEFQQAMLGIVGHDLRAPLGAIVIGTEMLAADIKDPANAHVLARIDSCAQRMTRMVDQLLDMTRARLGGGIPLARQRAPLLPLVRSVIDELALAHTGTRFELVGGADIVGVWDPDRLAQVASNLIGNAVHYGLRDAPIVVKLSRSAGAATITVHNQLRGQPISPEAIVTMFEPYRRGSGTERNGNGLGLGLYIVNEIVRAHGGAVTVESSAVGTTFRVVLPETLPGHVACTTSPTSS
jgi:signal transduction histidine kinase/DNA-binding response OmpR family regulator